MKQISAFQTSDGEVFVNQELARTHEELISKGSLIDEYLDSNKNPYNNRPQRMIAKNSIIAWEIWKRENGKSFD